MVACASCCSPWHEGQTCREYSRDLFRADFRSIEIEENGQSSLKVQECPNCYQALYKSEGCDHITCTCGHEFCYFCHAEYLRESTVSSILLVCHRSRCHYRNRKMQGFSIHGMSEAELFGGRWKLEFADASAGFTTTLDFTEPREMRLKRALRDRDVY